MAFTGVAVVKQVSDSLVRITGLSLAGGAIGTIALFESLVAPGVRLPASFKPRDYDMPDTAPVVSLQDSIQCWFVFTGPVSGVYAVNGPSVVKTGTKPEDFLITMTNAGEGDPQPTTPALEIYVRFH